MGFGLGQLLGQEFVKFEPLPGDVAAVFQAFKRGVRAGVMQELHGFAQAGQTLWDERGGDELVQRRAGQGRCNRLAQIGLRQLCAAGVHRCQGGGQGGTHINRLVLRVHHLAPDKPATHFTPHTQALAQRHGLLLAAVKVKKAQQQFAAGISHTHQQLAARALVDVAFSDRAFDLRHIAMAQAADGSDARFVFIAQGQVQGQVNGAHQAHALHGQCRRAFALFFGWAGGASWWGGGHGTILGPRRSHSALLSPRQAGTACAPCQLIQRQRHSQWRTLTSTCPPS